MRTEEQIRNNPKLQIMTNPMLTNKQGFMGYITLSNGKKGTVVCGYNEEGKWEHVSIRLYGNKLPTWEDMCEVKDIFWDEEEMVVQMHPKKSEYINITEALHLWKPVDGVMYF